MRVGCWVFFKQTIVVIFFKRRKKYSEEEEQSRGRKRIEEDQPEIAWEILSSLININKNICNVKKLSLLKKINTYTY